jgi:biotin operon repressor
MAEPLALQILQTISTNKIVPIEYLTFRLGSSRPEIERHIHSLENQGVIRRTDDQVEFVQVPHPSSVVTSG